MGAVGEGWGVSAARGRDVGGRVGGGEGGVGGSESGDSVGPTRDRFATERDSVSERSSFGLRAARDR